VTILVTGSKGQLGTDLVGHLEREGASYVAAGRADADFTDPAAIRSLVLGTDPSAVVNCAAFHDVAGCEADPELARAVNTIAVEALAAACAETGTKLMTISTDYVFDGEKTGGYTEDDTPNPLNVYGASKLEGERRALAAHERTFVVRSQSLFGHAGPSGKGLNFVDLMLKLSEERDEVKVDQFRMAPTSTVALAANLYDLLATDHFGLFHMSCHGETTWYEFAKEIFALAGRDTTVTAVGNDFYETPFVRPESSYLDNARLREVGVDRMPSWQDALAEYLRTRARHATLGSA
jgi:dTDP-4-dehydrorhamnose reductase